MDACEIFLYLSLLIINYHYLRYLYENDINQYHFVTTLI